mmetsp:Transcript_103762/g.292011  ORF Transcript_103762/g.292011 Transcript_103762/m.292011 type:complete len:407 (-) Transcript_103762:16-1236(-)
MATKPFLHWNGANCRARPVAVCAKALSNRPHHTIPASPPRQPRPAALSTPAETARGDTASHKCWARNRCGCKVHRGQGAAPRTSRPRHRRGSRRRRRSRGARCGRPRSRSRAAWGRAPRARPAPCRAPQRLPRRAARRRRRARRAPRCGAEGTGAPRRARTAPPQLTAAAAAETQRRQQRAQQQRRPEGERGRHHRPRPRRGEATSRPSAPRPQPGAARPGRPARASEPSSRPRRCRGRRPGSSGRRRRRRRRPRRRRRHEVDLVGAAHIRTQPSGFRRSSRVRTRGPSRRRGAAARGCQAEAHRQGNCSSMLLRSNLGGRRARARCRGSGRRPQMPRSIEPREATLDRDPRHQYYRRRRPRRGGAARPIALSSMGGSAATGHPLPSPHPDNTAPPFPGITKGSPV